MLRKGGLSGVLVVWDRRAYDIGLVVVATLCLCGLSVGDRDS